MNTRSQIESFIKDYPELTLDSKGYEELSSSIVHSHKHVIDKLESILRSGSPDFVRFQNFKPRKDGSVAVRCQVRYSPYFTGVVYYELSDFEES